MSKVAIIVLDNPELEQLNLKIVHAFFKMGMPSYDDEIAQVPS